MTYDRRVRRSNHTHEALGFQMEACREDASLEAMLISDDDGLCMAASGPSRTCEEVAAALPLLGRKAGDFAGVLLAEWGPARVVMQRLLIEDSPMYVCAIGDDRDLCARQIARSIGGVTRILAAA